MPAKKVLLSWSSGKDSCWALHVLRRNAGLDVVGLITTFNSAFDRVAMHAVRRPLLEAQAASIGLPLWPVELPWPCSNDIYEARMGALCARAVDVGVQSIAFGDLFLRDIRAYRERQLQGSGIEPLFPLWELSTEKLALDMIAGGVRAIVTCVDPRKLDRAFAGRSFDSAFLRDLPNSADPCGENGEFHTFAFDGPGFRYPVLTQPGEIVDRDGFVFADLLCNGVTD
ncbi:MAG: adenine nucleotide alpha hydrolase [Acidobacteriaceae bacterium]|nr:adenine nucleotide alpha hydrolase [Acidobacteriaceae bacterium]